VKIAKDYLFTPHPVFSNRRRVLKGVEAMGSSGKESKPKPSRKDDAKNTSQYSRDYGHCRGRVKEKSHRETCTRDNQARYRRSQYSNIPFDYKKFDNDDKSLLHRKSCIFCALYNHVVSKCLKIMATRKRTRRERPSPHQGRKKVK